MIAESATIQKGYHLVQNGGVTRYLNIVGGDIGKPEMIVGKASANALPSIGTGRKPPMLHIPFGELPRGGPQDVLTRHLRQASGHGHNILQLISKTVRATGLIKSRTRQYAAGDGLIEQPAIQHDVSGAVGRRHLNLAEHTVPMVFYLLQGDNDLLCGVFFDSALRRCRIRGRAQ